MENLANTENRVMQNLGARNQKKGKVLLQAKGQLHGGAQGVLPRHKKRLQKMRQRELFVKKEEEERDYWFNHLWPMTKPKQTWREKWLPKEEGSSYDDSNGGEAGRLTPARGEYNLGSGD
jgi:hypothetical protein